MNNNNRDEQQMASTNMDFFLRCISVDRYPPASEYLLLVHEISSKTQLPNPTALCDVLRLFEVLGSLCIQREMKESMYEWRVQSSFVKNLKFYQSLDIFLDTDKCNEITRACKPYADGGLFPTHHNRFIGISNSRKPVVVFNKDLAEVFTKNENVDFIFVDDIVRSLRKKNEQKKHSYFKSAIDVELLKILFLFKACGFSTLTDLYLTPDIAPGQISSGSYKWERMLYKTVPFIQQYIHEKHHEHYRSLQGVGFTEYLKKSIFFTTPGFEVVYRLKGIDSATEKRSKVAYIEHSIGEMGKATIYVLKLSGDGDDEKNADDIKLELAKLFVPNNNVEIQEDIHDFWHTLLIEDDVERLMRRRRISPLPRDEEKWEFPRPRDPYQPPKREIPKEEEKDEEMTDVSQPPQQQQQQQASGERPMTCWPPRNPGGSGFMSKPDSVRKSEEAILEKWKLPEGPDAKTVKTLGNDDSSSNVDKIRSSIPSSQHQQQKQNSSTENRSGYTTASPSGQMQSTSDSGRDQHSQQQQPQQSDEDKKKPSFDQDHVSNDGTKRGGGKVKCESNEHGSVDTREARDSQRGETSSRPHQVNNNNLSSGTPKSTPSTPIRGSRNQGVSPKGTPSKFNIDELPSYPLSSQYTSIDFQMTQDLESRFFQPIFAKPELSDDTRLAIGKIGEEVVYNYFCDLFREAIRAGNVEVQWMNADQETGQPYDMVIQHLNNTGMRDLYVEVKTTVADEEKQFEISSQQLRFAFETGEDFHLYRVSGLATQGEFRMKCLKNLSSHMDKKSVKTYMIL